MTKKLRKGKVFVDWSQNTTMKTTIAVYSLRARGPPTASTPLEWDEVESGARVAGSPTTWLRAPSRVLERIERHGDLFAPVLKLRAAPARGGRAD